MTVIGTILSLMRLRRKTYPKICDWLTDEMLEEFDVYLLATGHTLLIAKEEKTIE